MSTFPSVLAVLGGLVLVLTAATRVAAAAPALVRDCSTADRHGAGAAGER